MIIILENPQYNYCFSSIFANTHCQTVIGMNQGKDVYTDSSRPLFGEYTKLTVVHDRFPDGSKMLELVSGGWMHVIAGLKTLLETGKAVDFSKFM